MTPTLHEIDEMIKRIQEEGAGYEEDTDDEDDYWWDEEENIDQ